MNQHLTIVCSSCVVNGRSSIHGICATLLTRPVKFISLDVSEMTPIITKVAESSRRAFSIGQRDVVQSYISLIRFPAHTFKHKRKCLGTGKSYLCLTPLVPMGTSSTPNPRNERKISKFRNVLIVRIRVGGRPRFPNTERS